MLTCYGEALIDLIVSPYSPTGMRTASQACLGGSVFNFCIAAARQGLPTAYLNPLSHDSFGQQYRQLLTSEGVTLASTNPSQQPTAIAVVQLDLQGKASYAFHREAVADRDISAAQAIVALPPSTTVLHTGCLMLVPQDWPKTQAILQEAATRGACITVDANLRTVVCPDLTPYRASALAACAMAHVVKISDDDLIDIGLLGKGEGQDPVAAARKLLNQPTTQMVALTLGAAGAWLITRHAQVFQPSPTGITVADTVGAGDSFFAALLAYLQNENVMTPLALQRQLPQAMMQTALAHAVAAASINVTRVGCNPATWQETIAAT
jgi:fructokinase